MPTNGTLRYDVIEDDDEPKTYYVFDSMRGVVTSNGYLNKYVAVTEADRLNELFEEG